MPHTQVQEEQTTEYTLILIQNYTERCCTPSEAKFIFPFPSFQNQYMVNEHRKPDQKGQAGINPTQNVI